MSGLAAARPGGPDERQRRALGELRRQAVAAAMPARSPALLDGGPGPRLLRRQPLPTVSVIVAVRNGAAVLDRCLEALFAQDVDSLEVVVVDDGSTDGSAEVARRHAGAGGLVVESSGGRGAAAARNLGVARSRGEAVAFIDADGYAEPGWLRAAVTALEEDRSLGAVAPLVFFDAWPSVVNGAGATMDVRGYGRDHCFGEPIESAALRRDVLYTMSCGMVCRRAAFEDAGGFDEQIAHYYEDTELSVRLWRAGWRIVLAADARIDHGFGHSAPPERKALLNERGRIRTMLIHQPAPALPRWLAAEALWSLIPTEVRGVRRAAWAWNLRRLPGALAARRRWRGTSVPRHLFVPGREKLPEDPEPPSGRWLYGWYGPAGPGPHRWAARRAGLLVSAPAAATGMRIEYRTPPRSAGGRVELRRVGERRPLASAELQASPAWRTAEVAAKLPAGDYQLSFAMRSGYLDMRRRTLALALAEIGFATG